MKNNPLRGLKEIYLLLRSCFRWNKSGMAWPWVMLLTGLAGGVIAALTRWIQSVSGNGGSP